MKTTTQNLTTSTTPLLVIGLALSAALLTVPVNAAVITLDLNTFVQNGDPTNGDWVVSLTGDSVTQGLNGEPSYLVTPDSYRDLRIRGTVVTPATDDDFFGWSVAHETPSQDGIRHKTFLLDWKGAAQAHPDTGYDAPEGFALYRINGEVPENVNDLSACFWGKNDTNCPADITVLATAHGAGQGWEPGTSYDWSVRIEQNLIRLFVTGGTGLFAGGAIAIEAAPSVGVFQFGLFTYDQGGVEFRDVLLDDHLAPTITQTIDCVTPGANGWCLDELTLSSTAVDHGTGVASLVCRTQGADVDCAGSTQATEQAASIYRTTATDASGLVSIVEGTYQVDTELPEITPAITCDGGGNTAACETFLTFSASATDSMSGVDTIECDINNVAVPCVGAVELVEGIFGFRVNVTDTAGHLNTTTVTGVIDISAPHAVSLSSCNPWPNNGWCPRSADTRGTAVDDFSGVATVACALDGVDTTCAETTRTAEGSHTFTVVATDLTGRIDTNTTSWQTDSTRPAGALTSPAPGCSYLDDAQVECLGFTTASGDLTFNATASDALSGVDRVEYWVDGWKRATLPAAGPFGWTWDTSDESLGEHQVELRIVDMAGNFEQVLLDVTVLPGLPTLPE